MTSATARSLKQLTKMNITSCKTTEQIIAVTDLENEVEEEMVFGELEYLRLEFLPSLGRFGLENCTLEFPSSKLRICFPRVLITPILLTAEQSEEEDEGWREDDNNTIRIQGVSSTPILQTAQEIEEEDEGRGEDDDNTIIQQMFTEMVREITFIIVHKKINKRNS